jgi:hypothetical protein
MGLAGPSGARPDDDEDMEGGEAGKHTFAPRDTKLVVYQAKDDREGLGFQKGMGMGRLPQSRKAGPCEYDVITFRIGTDQEHSVSVTSMTMMTMTIHTVPREHPLLPSLSLSIMLLSRMTT